MKLFTLLSALALLPIMLCAQERPSRLFYMPDGSVVRGSVVEELSSDSVRVETIDGDEFVISRRSAKHGNAKLSPLEPTATVADVDGARQSYYDTIPSPAPVTEQELFAIGARQYGVDLRTHFSSGSESEDRDPEAGILLTFSAVQAVSPRLFVGAGGGLLTVKAGSKEVIFPLYARAGYQLTNRLSGWGDVGYGLASESGPILSSTGGLFGNVTLYFDLVGPLSKYTSRIGIGVIHQQLSFERLQRTTERSPFGSPGTIEEYVSRTGSITRFQFSIAHVWRHNNGKRAAKSPKRGKRLRN